MIVVHHTHLAQGQAGGCHWVAAAGPALGVQAFQVWACTLPPGADTGALCHAGELVVLVAAGGGKLRLDGGPLRFAGPCTLRVPPGLPFELANPGLVPLQTTWVFTAAPVPLPGA